MRKIAFNVVAFLGGTSIHLLREAAQIITSLVGFVFISLIKLSGRVSGALLHLIDKERLTMYSAFNEATEIEEEGYTELERQTLELKLFSAVSDLKAHAEVDEEGWTERHTEALNAVATSLIEELGCDEDEVLAYMRRVVESIPGLSFDIQEDLD